MAFLNTYIMNRPEIMVSFAENKFDRAGRLTDKVMRQKAKEFIVAMLQWIIKFDERNHWKRNYKCHYKYCQNYTGIFSFHDCSFNNLLQK